MKTLLIAALAVAACSGSAQQRLTLPEALRLARQNSPVLAAAQAEVDAAVAGSRAARARTLPQVSANGFATTGNQTSILGSPPMTEPSASMMTAPGTLWAGNLMLMVPIVASRLSAMGSAASSQARAAAGDLEEARAEVDLRVTEAFFGILRARQMVKTAEARLAATQEVVKNAETRLETGSGIEANVARARSEAASAERELASARNEEAKAVLELQATIGKDPSGGLTIDEDAPAHEPPTLEEALRRAKESRGAIRAAKARVEAASAEVRAAHGQRAPQLYGIAMGDATNRRDMGGVTLGLTVSVPLFDGGRIAAEAAQARAMHTQAKARLKEAVLTVEKEVRQAALDLQTARTNAASAEASVRAAESAYEVIAMRVTAGKGILVEQLDALQAMTEARADFASAEFDVQLAAARLLRAAGGSQ